MRFSVIIPLYNKGPYVTKAIKSVIGQTFHDYELIVVDDGSIDESYDNARSVLESSSIQYRLIHQDNAGVSIARNNGVAVSSGEYFCFLDADDWWDYAFLERINALIIEYPDAGIYGTNYYYVKNGRQSVCVKGVDTGYIDYCRVYADSLIMPLTSISVAIPKPIFNEMGGFRSQLKLGEDFDLWIKIALKYKVAFLNEPLAFYFQDSNPSWRGIKQLVDPQYHMLWNLDYLSEQETLRPDYKRLIDSLRTHSLLHFYLRKDYRTIASKELDKVDWDKQPKDIRRLYSLPIPVLRLRSYCLSFGSYLKQRIRKLHL